MAAYCLVLSNPTVSSGSFSMDGIMNDEFNNALSIPLILSFAISQGNIQGQIDLALVNAVATWNAQTPPPAIINIGDIITIVGPSIYYSPTSVGINI